MTSSFTLYMINAHDLINLPIGNIFIGMKSGNYTPQGNVCTYVGHIVLLSVKITINFKIDSRNTTSPTRRISNAVVRMRTGRKNRFIYTCVLFYPQLICLNDGIVKKLILSGGR